MLRRPLRPARRRRVRQGQQRRRRSRRRRGCCAAGACGSRCSSSRTGIDRGARSTARSTAPTSSSTRCSAPGFRGALDGDAAWVVERARRGAGGSSSRSTSRRASTGSPARSTGRRCAPTAPSRSPRAKPGLVFEPGRSHAGEVTVADIGIDVGDGERAAAQSTAWTSRRGRLAPAARARARTSGSRRRDGGRRVTRA